MALSLKLKSKKSPSPPATDVAKAVAAAGGEPARPPMFVTVGGNLYQKYRTALGDMAVPVEEAPPVVKGPYRAYHTPGRRDNEWEVRDDDDGLLVTEIVGSDFDVAKRRATRLAGWLNAAYARGVAGK